LRDSGFGLEAILRQLSERTSSNRRFQFLQIAPYLADLMGSVGRKYVPAGGGTKYDTLVAAVEDSGYDRVLYLTVNYDLLLERARAQAPIAAHHAADRIETSVP
jgi:hypothetical protein